MPKATYVAICRYESGSDPTVYVGTYDEVILKAGAFWKNGDLDFDTRGYRFYVNPDSGYDTDVTIIREGNKSRAGKIIGVSHADGDGMVIEIVRASK